MQARLGDPFGLYQHAHAPKPLCVQESLRRTTPDERSDARRASLALFGLGIALILIGAGFDPSRSAF